MTEPAASECPSLAALIRLSDGEASPAERRQISAHLWRCSSCRARLAEADSLAEECVAALESGEALDRPPENFAAGLHRHMSASQARADVRSRRWVVAAVAIPAVVLILILSRSHTAVVQAEELLSRTLQAEETLSTPRRAARMRWTPGVVAGASRYEPVVAPDSASAVATAQASDMIEADALALLRPYGIDPQKPLSIKPFRTWRAGLTERRDSVREKDGLVVLETTTTQGEIRSAEVVVRGDTFLLVRESFVFAGRGRLDIVLNEADEDGHLTRHDPAVSEHPPASVAANPREFEHAELRVRLALRATDLDLDGRVRLTEGKPTEIVRLEGVASHAARTKLVDLLADVQGVEVSVRSGQGSALDEPSPRALTTGMARWLDRKYGSESSPAKSRFVPELQHSAALIVRRLEALEALSTRYPARIVNGLAPEDRALVQTLVNQHYAALAGAIDSYGTHIAVLTGSTQALPVARTTAPRDWRTPIHHAMAPAKELERRLLSDELFDGAGSTDVEVAAAVQSAFARLWNAVNIR